MIDTRMVVVEFFFPPVVLWFSKIKYLGSLVRSLISRFNLHAYTHVLLIFSGWIDRNVCNDHLRILLIILSLVQWHDDMSSQGIYTRIYSFKFAVAV